MRYDDLSLHELSTHAARLLADGRTAEAGALLAEVRSQCKRGAWGAFLAHAGIGRRRAQRAMARNGVRRNATPEIDYLADFGMTLAALAASTDVSPSTMRRAILKVRRAA